MNKHLKSCVERDKRKVKRLISPICKVDAEIIWELQVVLGKLELGELKSIIEEWKYLKDEEVYSLLLQWNIDHPEGFNDDNEENKEGRKFIDFEGELVELSLIKSVSKDDHYNYTTNQLEYRVIINKDFPENTLLKDVVFLFPTDEVRENKLKQLKKNLSKKIKII